jgi:hypothetical protein
VSINLTCSGTSLDPIMRGLTELFLRGRTPDHKSLRIKSAALEVDTGHWQSLRGVPQTSTIELQNVHVTLESLPSVVRDLKNYFQPNLPWAEDHFQERVCGEPLNPGYEYRNWPWYANNVEEHKQPGQFSHTYMERFWPRKIRYGQVHDLKGIRYRYGDLNDLIDLLVHQPYTRQAFLPIFFPEDTGAHHHERVPCTLGYHFLLRDNKLHIFYPIRSMDFMRYMRDDLYMAGRLGHWIIDQCEKRCPAEGDNFWNGVMLGELNLFASSLHIFPGDVATLRRKGMPIMKGWEDDD